MTLQEVLITQGEKFALDTGAHVLKHIELKFPEFIPYIYQAMKEFAKEQCKIQREICSESAEMLDYIDIVNKSSILNAPEPTFY